MGRSPEGPREGGTLPPGITQLRERSYLEIGFPETQGPEGIEKGRELDLRPRPFFLPPLDITGSPTSYQGLSAP